MLIRTNLETRGREAFAVESCVAVETHTEQSGLIEMSSAISLNSSNVLVILFNKPMAALQNHPQKLFKEQHAL